jgi:hypothetical protein
MRNHIDTIAYGILFILAGVNAYLLTSPNLFGKIGLIVYRYQFIRSFPRAFIMVCCVVALGVTINWLTQIALTKKLISRRTCNYLLTSFILLSSLLLIKLIVNFSRWTYSHTGFAFKVGVLMLPCLLILIFGYRLSGIVPLSWRSPASPSEQPSDPEASCDENKPEVRANH